jgi:hypothetical protein
MGYRWKTLVEDGLRPVAKMYGVPLTVVIEM